MRVLHDGPLHYTSVGSRPIGPSYLAVTLRFAVSVLREFAHQFSFHFSRRVKVNIVVLRAIEAFTLD